MSAHNIPEVVYSILVGRGPFGTDRNRGERVGAGDHARDRTSRSPVVTGSHGRIALRNAGLLLIQRGGLIAAGFLFATVVPRLMGPQLYGRYSLVLSLTALFVVSSALGFTEVVGRYVPTLRSRPDPSDLRRLFGNLIVLRLASGALAAFAYLAATVFWLHELDPVALGAAAGAVLARGLSQCLFSFFVGMNQAARWGAGDLMTRWLLLAFVIPGFLLGGFRGACIGLLLTELNMVAVSVWWNRAHLSWRWLRLDLGYVTPYLRFGAGFFGGNLLSIAFHGSGETLVRAISGDYAEVSYFGLANGVFVSAAAAMQQVSLAFAAPLVALRQRGQAKGLEDGARRLVSWLTSGSMALVFAVLLLGMDFVPPMLGSFYARVATNLIPMTLVLLAVSLSSTAGVVVLAHDQPGVALEAAGIRLVAFGTLAPWLIGRWASLGACVAILVAATLHAAYLGWRVRAAITRALRAWITTAGLGALFLPLVLLRADWLVNAALYLIFLGGYFGLLMLAGIITRGEIRATWGAMTQAGSRPGGAADEAERP